MFHWGSACVGDLRRRGSGSGVHDVPQGSPAVDPLATRTTARTRSHRRKVSGIPSTSIAIIGTLFGVATSLGFGVQQISAGLDYLGWVETGNWLTVVTDHRHRVTGHGNVLGCLRSFTKGLKWLSNINMVLAAESRDLRSRCSAPLCFCCSRGCRTSAGMSRLCLS